MTHEEIDDLLCFPGDACYPPEGEHDLRQCVVEVISRMPEEVQSWLLNDTQHVFVTTQSIRGVYHDLLVAPPPFGETRDGLRVLRIIVLSDVIARDPIESTYHTIAHEIAHSYRNDSRSSADIEELADAQAAAWGFPTPADRAEVIAVMRNAEKPRGGSSTST